MRRNRKTGATSSRARARSRWTSRSRSWHKAGYQGYYCFEWEKKWHPEIEDPEIAFPHYAKLMAEYLTAAGVKPK